ncbi:PH domain-containing protein [Methanolobus bombayensis]|uniref:PH domain-containing protein n=1 Tax=Methanolobus bombayensis TaxID=38023 RepID=UPI001AE8BF71|nr:PH domain-containing protein [Methanolobus bombayensis]MBP1908296.1 hypothetical protein [Methanolobus bombayensis]
MPSLETIKDQIIAIDNKFNLKLKSIKELPNILDDDELIENLCTANQEGAPSVGLLIATNKRLIFVKKSIFASHFEEFPYSKIDSIHFKSDILNGKVTILSFGNNTEFLSAFKKKLQALTEHVRQKMSEMPNNSEQTTNNYYHYGDVIGTQIQDSVLVKSNAETQVNMCNKCGCKAERGQKFCSNCGKELTFLSLSENNHMVEGKIVIDTVEVRNYLIRKVLDKKLVSYAKFRDDFGLDYTIQTFNLLKQISRDCIERNEPLLSAIVVNDDNLPGEGFFDNKTRTYLGYNGPATGSEAKKIHQRELDKLSNWKWDLKTMIVTAWNNGQHHKSGAGYGLKISLADRNQNFKKEWEHIVLEMPDYPKLIKVNIKKDSFWNGTCRELISKDIGLWMISKGDAPWSDGKPPKYRMEHSSENNFSIKSF